jgi:hypothetical protein
MAAKTFVDFEDNDISDSHSEHDSIVSPPCDSSLTEEVEYKSDSFNMDWADEDYRDLENAKIQEALSVPLTDEELAIMWHVKKNAHPTDDEMWQAYSDFRSKEKADEKAKEDTMIQEISEWVESGNAGPLTGPTVEADFKAMKSQKKAFYDRCSKERLEQMKKDTELARVKYTEIVSQVSANSRQASAQRDLQKRSTCNAKGKLQGQLNKPAAKVPEVKPPRVIPVEKSTVPELSTVDDFLGDDIPEDSEGEDEFAPNIPLREKSQLESLVSSVSAAPKTGPPKPKKTKKVKVLLDIWSEPAPKPEVKSFSEPKTRMCSAVLSGRTCSYGDRCKFAHKVEHLSRKECTFGSECRYVRPGRDGSYHNTHPERMCNYWHPRETVRSYGSRIGLKDTPVPCPEPVKIDLRSRPRPPQRERPKPRTEQQYPRLLKPSQPPTPSPEQSEWQVVGKKKSK